MPGLDTPLLQQPGTDQANPPDQPATSFSIDPSAVSSQDILQREAAQQQEALQTAQTNVSLQRQATPAEQQATPSTDLTDQTVSAANQVVGSYNKYILQGGDLSKLSKDDLDAVINGAESLPAIEHPETDPARMLAMYRKGTLKPTTANLGLIGHFVKGAVNTLGNIAQEGFAQAANIIPGVTDDKNAWLKYWVKTGTDDAMAARSIPDQWNALIKGTGDIWNATALAMEQGGTTDPDRGAQIDAKQAEIIRQRMVRQTGAEKAMTDVRDGIANVYKSVGANELADTVMSAKPDDPTVQFAQTVMDPMNYLMAGGEGLAEKAFAGTMKAGVRGQRLADATAAIQTSLDRQAAAALGRTQIESALASRVPMADTARSGMESNLSRIKTVQGNLGTVHDAATTEYQAALADVNDQMTRMATSDPSRNALATLANTGVGAANTVAKINDALDTLPEILARKVAPNAGEEAQTAIAQGIRKYSSMGADWAGGMIGHALGGLGGIPVGYAGARILKSVGDVAGTMLDAAKPIARELSLIGDQLALGQQTLPFLRAYAEKTSGLPATIASKLDKSAFAPVIYASPQVAAGAAIGSGLGAAQGYLASGGDPRAAAQGAGGGFVFGMAGSGLGQIGKFNSPATLRQAAIGDRARFLKSLAPADAKLFQALGPEHQLAVSVYGQAHPDLDIHFENNPGGPNGSWHATTPRASAMINVASDNPTHAILAHEIGHHIANNGLSDDVNKYVLGDPITGMPGLTTALDDAGKPITERDPITGKTTFVQDETFQKYKADYNARKMRDVPGSTPEDDAGIAQEMFADLHAAYLARPDQLQKAIRGHIPSDIVSENTAHEWLSKVGMASDGVTGNPFPTGDLSKAKDLQNVVDNYYKQRINKAKPLEEDRGATKVVVGDAVKGTPAFDQLTKKLDSTGDLARNPDGSIATDLAGRPIIKSKREADKAHAQLANAVLDIYKNQPGLTGATNPNSLQLVTDRPSTPGGKGRTVYRGQVIPDAVFDQIASSNQHNQNQILNWRKLNGIMARDDGTMTNGVYNTASTGKGRYATLAARERSLVPLYTEISPETKQVNFQMYDPEQLQTHVTKMLKSKTGKEIWNGQMGPALEDVRTYMNNLANNRPGETGIGLQKKGVINEMFGVNADANPYASGLTKRPTNQSVFKTFRLDRINRIMELTGERQPVTSQTYEQVRSFMQPREGQVIK